MEESHHVCEGCHLKDGSVTIRQNDLNMCDLCWGKPMSPSVELDRSSLILIVDDSKHTNREKNAVSSMLNFEDSVDDAMLDIKTPTHCTEESLLAVKHTEDQDFSKLLSTTTETENEKASSEQEQPEINESQEKSQEEQIMTTGVLFADTLIQALGKRKVKGKDKFKFKLDGTLKDLKSFIELVLNRKGTWKGKKDKKQTFQDGEITLSWTPSSKNLELSGYEVEKTEEVLNNLIEKVKNKQDNDVNETKNDKTAALRTTEASVKGEINHIWKAIIEIKSIVNDYIHNGENDSTKKNPKKGGGGKQENQNQETATPDTKLRSSQEKQLSVPLNANKASPMVDVTDYKQQTVTNYFKPVEKKSYDKLVIRSSKISTLETTVSKMEKRHKELTSQIEQLKRENKELRNKLKGIETKSKTNKLTNQAPEKAKQQKSPLFTPHGTKKQQSQPLEASKKHVNQESTQNEKQQAKKQQQQSKQQQQRKLKQQR